jgi:hypothetical protein
LHVLELVTLDVQRTKRLPRTRTDDGDLRSGVWTTLQLYRAPDSNGTPLRLKAKEKPVCNVEVLITRIKRGF